MNAGTYVAVNLEISKSIAHSALNFAYTQITTTCVYVELPAFLFFFLKNHLRVRNPRDVVNLQNHLGIE